MIMSKDKFDSVELTEKKLAALPFSQACENNKQAILQVLQHESTDYNHVLEIGSGTGQHSVHFAPQLPHLQWQTSDVKVNHSTIIAWHNEYPALNLPLPLAFDLNDDSIPILENIQKPYDVIFTANTLHIISWALVERLFALAGDALPVDGKLIVYGPFNENGKYTSEGNQRFDAMLRSGNADSGIRHKEDIIALANAHYLALITQYQMPANNQILVFQKTTAN